jgi:hypothetical protein
MDAYDVIVVGALRVGDHLLERMGVTTTPEEHARVG